MLPLEVVKIGQTPELQEGEEKVRGEELKMDISHTPSSPANNEPENRKRQASFERKSYRGA